MGEGGIGAGGAGGGGAGGDSRKRYKGIANWDGGPGNMRINLTNSDFPRFMEKGFLYVDKTLFVEHFLDETGEVVLITRPRRMGKSLNMSMLAAFLDSDLESEGLFRGLAIEGRPCYREALNRFPVIYMSFRTLRPDTYQSHIRMMLCDAVEKYVKDNGALNRGAARMLADEGNYDASNLLFVTQSIERATGARPFVLIDEYDKILMDNAREPVYEEIRKYLTAVFGSALKDNRSLGKALLTGVTRVSRESMFSDLNNIEVYDVFRPSAFDEDFGLTEDEARALVPGPLLPDVRAWYNNVRVGSHSQYYIYSVMSCLANGGRLSDYWGASGAIDMLCDLMTPGRAVRIGEALRGGAGDGDGGRTADGGRAGESASFVCTVDPRLSLKMLFPQTTDEYFFSLAVQAGYLTFDPDRSGLDEELGEFRLRVPNIELRGVWRKYILNRMMEARGAGLETVFARIGDTEAFSRLIEEFIRYQLSYHDTGGMEVERIYHVFVFGMVLSLGYRCSSNMERGLGRYDLFIQAPNFDAVIEFKRAKSERGLRRSAAEALKQIDDMHYGAAAREGSKAGDPRRPGLPLYKIGIACYKALCAVKAVNAVAA